MSEQKAKANVISAWLSIALFMLTLPLWIGATAFFEEKVIGTYYVSEVCRAIGIFEPLRQLAQFFGSN